MFEWKSYSVPVATVAKDDRSMNAKIFYLLQRRIEKQERALTRNMRNVFGSCEEQHQKLENLIESFGG